MQNEFEIAGGSIPGGDHLQRGNTLIGKNNQDARCIHQDAQATIAIVSDGCGSWPRSEVGSNIGSQLLKTALLRQWPRHAARAKTHGFDKLLPMVLEATRQDVIAQLRLLSQAIAGDGSFSAAICDNFLFTLVGALITECGAGFFAIGDGLIIVNGEEHRIGPFPGNEPPYISYALTPTRWKDEELRFVIHKVLPVAELKHFLIGTDGAGDLLDKRDAKLPGYPTLIGPIEQFWTNNQYFTDTGIQKRLKLINSRHVSVKDMELCDEKPRLPDDTTFVVGRRKAEGK